MAGQEQQRVQQFFDNRNTGNRVGDQLVFDPRDQRIRVVGAKDPDKGHLNIGAEDMGFSRHAEVKDHDRYLG